MMDRFWLLATMVVGATFGILGYHVLQDGRLEGYDLPLLLIPVALAVALYLGRPSAHAQEEKLPRMQLLGIEDLPPQVRLTFEMEDEDAARLARLARKELTPEEQDQLLVGEFIRRGIVETVARLEAGCPSEPDYPTVPAPLEVDDHACCHKTNKQAGKRACPKA